jgi:hypothetical protein
MQSQTQIYERLIAFPWQQWLCVRASMLRDTYIACLIIYSLRCINGKESLD